VVSGRPVDLHTRHLSMLMEPRSRPRNFAIDTVA
jgi:hypothetical protein